MSGPSLRFAIGRILAQTSSDPLRIRWFHTKEFVRCTTPLKLINLGLAKVQRWLGRDRVFGLPAKYFIDPINICNLRCPLCPTGRGVLARPRGRMELELAKRVIDQIAPYAYRIELYNWGEPFLHPDIFAMIEYASQRRITVGLSSNLNYLNADLARRLVESGLSQLIVSIDGATQESYAAYRRGGKLNDVLQNLKMVVESKRALERQMPFIIWRMLIGKHNEHEVEVVRRMAYELGADGFSTGMLLVDTQDPEQVKQWLPKDPAHTCYDYSKPNLENVWDCHELWEVMVINWDGGVAPCCWLHDPQFDFGNVANQTVREIWNGPYYVSARRAIVGHTRKSSGMSTICQRCRGHPHYLAY